jgi:hypothetical protein
MRKLGPKALLSLSAGTTVLGAQLAAFARDLPGSQPVLVVGYESERVIREVPPHVMVVENELYEDCGIGRTLEIGCRVCVRPRLLVVYGDLVLGPSFLHNLPRSGSWAFLGEGRGEEVGANVVRGRVEAFTFAQKELKWSQAVLLDGEELDCFKHTVKNYRDRLGHELLNHIIDRGGVIRMRRAGEFREIDSTADLARAREFFS